ncbi:4-carboxymuconolactone decarboxylase [Cryobacterium frigoriphilum]|uniref:4-carboxymuconolactone decarboxylase n=1 Tax=Cryobacterium frigoriphilum TaxID=1259150 RepID=A0A4R9A975_9MICO|nr:4-carboxymuconolactone decarboxylase [Cryobacterium frigoriphilum]
MSHPTLLCTLDPALSGAGDAPLLVLGPSLGTTTALWAGLVATLSQTHRVLRFDLPGHGMSPAATDAFTVADLAAAVIDLVDAVGGGDFHYAGISLGGAVGLQLALDYPQRLTSLAVICSGSVVGTPEGWLTRAAQVRASGTPALIVGSAERWFAPGFLERDPGSGSAALHTLMDIDDESYARCCEALAGFDVTDAVGGIRTPTLLVAGALDQVISTASMRQLGERMPTAQVAEVAEAAHLPSLERPEALAALLLPLIAPTPLAAVLNTPVLNTPAPNTPVQRDSVYDAGMVVRREVLGDAHVDRATAAITPETADFQDFITRYAWGEIWTRPGLDRRTRSFLTIAALVTGGHEGELAMHVRAALTNGLSRAEISEAILHTAIYAGVPAANAAFAIARETFADLDAAGAALPADLPATN